MLDGRGVAPALGVHVVLGIAPVQWEGEWEGAVRVVRWALCMVSIAAPIEVGGHVTRDAHWTIVLAVSFSSALLPAAYQPRPDLFLSFLFLTAIDNAKWGDDAIDPFSWFFHDLDNHPVREEGD